MGLKRVLGLDLGTNSIGWALVKEDFENHALVNNKQKSHGVRRIKFSSAYSLVVNCLSISNIIKILLCQNF